MVNAVKRRFRSQEPLSIAYAGPDRRFPVGKDPSSGLKLPVGNERYDPTLLGDGSRGDRKA